MGDAEDDNCDIKAVAIVKKRWFHVSRLPLDVDELNIKKYVMDKFALLDCVCTKIRPRLADKSTFNSFKVGVDSQKSDHFLAPGNWPRGIAVSPWEFYTPRHEQQTSVRTHRQHLFQAR